MKKWVIHLLVLVLLIMSCETVQAKKRHRKQISKGFTGSYSFNFGDSFTSNNIMVGYKLSDRIEGNKKMYWQADVDLNWTNYRLFNSGNYSYFNNSSNYRSTSISIPIVLGYELRRSFLTRTKIYGGAMYDLILTFRLGGKPYYDLDYGQWALTVGAKMRILGLLDAGIGYKYYPRPLFMNGDMNRSAISFSVGF